MKSERRHQMQQNELAEVLGGGLNTLAPYARAIAIGVLGIVVIALVVNFITTREQAQLSTASLDFLLATNNEDPESFNRVNSDFPDTQPGHWARQAQSDLNLAQGLEALFIDRDEANDFIDTAIEGYKSVIAMATDPLLKTRAHYGLAKAYEAQGELQSAITEYEAVSKSSTSEAMAKQAQARISALSSTDTKDFYSWFRNNLPESKPTDPPALPEFGNIPDSPTAGLPAVNSPDDLKVSDVEPPAEQGEQNSDDQAPKSE